jgi:hypothetical protein
MKNIHSYKIDNGFGKEPTEIKLEEGQLYYNKEKDMYYEFKEVDIHGNWFIYHTYNCKDTKKPGSLIGSYQDIAPKWWKDLELVENKELNE